MTSRGTGARLKHPNQPTYVDRHGFRASRRTPSSSICSAPAHRLNALAMMQFSKDDRAQLAAAFGYSVSGWGVSATDGCEVRWCRRGTGERRPVVDLRDFRLMAVTRIRDAFGRKVRRVCSCSRPDPARRCSSLLIARGAALRASRICVLVHRAELVDQVRAGRSTSMGVEHGVIMAGRTSPTVGCAVQVASVQTLVRRLAQYPHFGHLSSSTRLTMGWRSRGDDPSRVS